MHGYNENQKARGAYMGGDAFVEGTRIMCLLV